LGIFKLTSSVFVQGKEYQQQEQLSVVSSNKPKLYSYTIVNEYPHDKTAYTQGLEFYRDTLYESTGLRGKSSLRKVNYQTGELYQQITLDKVYFGEGISFLNDKLYQLTWQGNIGFQYEPNKLSMERSFAYQKSKEGWGLCNDGLRLYKSDGTHHIWFLDPEKQQEIGSIQVMTDKKAISKINELEWVNGKIYANTYQMSKEVGIIIDPNSGAVEGVIDFSGLKEKVEQVSNLDVLNGIAYHPKKQSFFVTGKNWSKLFEVKITPKK
jgi:glutamine cyclotransferase